MSASIEEKHRHVFPRWRSFQSTAALGELSSPSSYSKTDTSALDLSLAKGIADWEGDPTLWKGLDLLGSAIVAGRIQEFSALVAEVKANPLTPKVARDTFDTISKPRAIQLDLPSVEQIPDLGAQREIREQKQSLVESPRDAIAWIELARAYTIAGVNKKAGRAVAAALQLAPTNRYVLRSAARFLIHIGNRHTAYELLSQAPQLKQDTWLLASHMAIGSALGKPPRWARIARARLESDLPPADLSELASALGTIETESGNLKNGRKLLRQALIRPNENSVAQARWLNRVHLGNTVDVSQVNPPLLHEANAWSSFYNADFTGARDEALSWLRDQPFASAPAILSSFILADVIGDYETGRDITRAALRANPDDISLLNNLAVCLIENGELDEAERVVSEISSKTTNVKDDAIRSATAGMLEFRRGNIEEGRNLYLDAIEVAKNSGVRTTAARAAIHLAVEEFTARTPLVELSLMRLGEYKGQEQILELTGLLQRLHKLISNF